MSIIRDKTRYPRLPRLYWGDIIYATPGSGKTYIASKYCDVVDADDLMVKIIEDIAPQFYIGNFDDPREVICRYFGYINFNRNKMNRVYKRLKKKMKEHTSIDDVVLLGTRDLLHYADHVFVQQDSDIVRGNFDQEKERQKLESSGKNKISHEIDGYLEKALLSHASYTTQLIDFSR